MCSQEVDDDAALGEDNDAGGESDGMPLVGNDAYGKDADTDADGKDADGDGGVLPPAGTPRASCQLTLLTSPARVTRDGHSMLMMIVSVEVLS